MAYSINTNIASMQAQDYLRLTTDFQNKTINRVTSGLRIVSSGDDAAGLAIANTFRSDRSVLMQGIRNANDGLSTLQTIDGGINNISQLLDRARTLAAQSASGTFTGDRNVLNTEFQSVIDEIDRQAQSIGLNAGGTFAKSLSVFIGGGRGTTATDTAGQITNGSVTVDLSTSTVDTTSLGLTGAAATGAVTNGLQVSSASSVAKILADSANLTDEANTTVFYFTGAGFAGNDRIKVKVNTATATDTATLVSEINKGITTAGNGTTAAATAFKNANISASVYTDADGKEQIRFTSPGAAFQVNAGDMVSNALLGKINSSAADTRGYAVRNSDAGANITLTNTFDTTGKVIVRIMGGGLNAAEDFAFDVTAATTTVQSVANSLSSLIAADEQLKAAGITLDTPVDGSPLTFRSSRGDAFSVQVVGDTGNDLGLGAYLSTGTSFDYSSITSSGAHGTTAETLTFSFGGGQTVAITTGTIADSNASSIANEINRAVSALTGTSLALFQNAGIVATASGTDVQLASNNGSFFRLHSQSTIYGFASSGVWAAEPVSAAASTVASVQSQGAYQASSASGTDKQLFLFDNIETGADKQTVSITGVDANGTKYATQVTLQQNSTTKNGRFLDEAVAAINAALQATNQPTLQKIVAVKDSDGTNEGIRFLSTLKTFEVSLASVAANGSQSQGISDNAGNQGLVNSSSQVGTGANADISTIEGAEAAVTALGQAVTTLGSAQAVVGKGQNNFTYAINLASTQLNNLAASESRIRDADLALEAANLTKAQILQQAGIAALAQANSAPQVVLTLLRG